mmetsp:Transcript_49837/g.155957  ORF Transcript_49837/g.155957 Transcript_49837/m.155957 type:complete len:83 (-) Transcript_49837:718-966(-)
MREYWRLIALLTETRAKSRSQDPQKMPVSDGSTTCVCSRIETGKDSEQKPTESRRSKSYVSIYNHRKIEERAEDRGSPSLPS